MHRNGVTFMQSQSQVSKYLVTRRSHGGLLFIDSLGQFKGHKKNQGLKHDGVYPHCR